jgi:hypothetical protein
MSTDRHLARCIRAGAVEGVVGMRTGLVVWGTAGVLALTGCTGSGSSGSPTEGVQRSTAEPSASEAGPRIPDGSWSKVATAAEARRRGLDGPDVREVLGSDGRLPITWRLAGDRWTILVTEDDGLPVRGDEGTLQYDSQGGLVTVSESEGCPGCVGKFTWTLVGDALTLTFAPGSTSTKDDDRLVTEGTFRRDR